MPKKLENAAANGTEPYLRKFDKFEKEAKQPSWVFPMRKAGLARVAELGFPTLKDEDWRFTNVAPIAKLPFKPVFHGRFDGVTNGALNQLAFASLPASRLVFVNGHFAKELSTIRSVPDGVKV